MSQSAATQIRDLKAQLTAEQERRSHVREYWFPWPGHAAGEFCGVSMHTLDGKHWALLQSAQFAAVTAWDGWHWQTVFPQTRAAAYRFTFERAERLAPLLAAEQAHRFGPRVEPVDLVKGLVRTTEMVVGAVRQMVSDGAVA